MKFIYPLLFVVLLSGCNRNKFVDIAGTVNGFTSGTVIIKDADNKKVLTANIEDGKFHIHQILDYAGYYSINIFETSYQDERRPGYTVYLEPGDYTLTAVPETEHQYPVIKSSSATQNELSAYYAIANPKSASAGREIGEITGKKSGKLSPDESDKLASELDTAMRAYDKALASALLQYVSQNPQNHIGAHIMYQLDYASDPETYNGIYQKFSDEEKKTTEGTEEGEKLNTLMMLMPGNIAPQLAGKTPDGKAFDAKTINKKLILVEFWRSSDDRSRENHQKLTGDEGSPLRNKDFTIVSFSLDTDKQAWTNAVKEDKLNWLQVSDLKGENSPVMNNWQINKIPAYFLVDGNWKIIKSNVFLGEVPIELNKYLKMHQGK